MELTESVTAVEGSTVELRCPATGNRTPNVFWTKDGSGVSDLPGEKVR